MLKSYIASFIVIGIILSQQLATQGCSIITNTHGSITDNIGTTNLLRIYSYESYTNIHSYENCWELKVLANKYVTITVDKATFGDSSCTSAYLLITNTDTNTYSKYCGVDPSKNSVTALSDVKIEFYVSSGIKEMKREFKISYQVKDIECAYKNSFRCSEYSCIPKAEVCDGVKDCENGADESNCKRGISTVPGVADSLSRGIYGLKSKRSKSWGWHENTARAVTALYLSGGATFNGQNKDEELMAKQTELKTAVALLKNPIPSEQLSMFIHALLVTCHNPRLFYGQDLVGRLQKQVENSKNFTHPTAYLALCNADSSLPTGSSTYLSKILQREPDYPFIIDIQAFAVMTIACCKNRSAEPSIINNATLMSQYQNAIQRFKQYQLPDGSFGNNHTTSLITQALISSGEEEAQDWKVNATVKYLMAQLDSSDFDFLATYLVLPVMNRKSLADIAHVKCTDDSRKLRNDDFDVNDYTGPKMGVQYSLFIGDETDIIHTLWLRVPENYTAFEVMNAATEEDTKYMFDWKKMSDSIYVFRIGKLTNDPEAGMFWLLYLKSDNTTEAQHSTISPDKLILNDGDHLVMWFRKAYL